MSTSLPLPDPNVVAILEAGRRRGRFTSRKLLIAAAILFLATCAFLVMRSRAGVQGPRWELSSPRPSDFWTWLSAGSMVITVSATGTLEPINEVNVGSELSGLISTVLVNENDRVKKGQVLAQLDLSLFEDQVAKSQSTLASAEANVLRLVLRLRKRAPIWSICASSHGYPVARCHRGPTWSPLRPRSPAR